MSSTSSPETSSLYGVAAQPSGPKRPGPATAFAVITLLVTGITFLKGKGYAVLLSAVIAQLALMALYVAIMLLALDSIIQSTRNKNSETGALMIIIFYILIGLGMTVSNLVLLYKPATRQWQQWVKRVP